MCGGIYSRVKAFDSVNEVLGIADRYCQMLLIASGMLTTCPSPNRRIWDSLLCLCSGSCETWVSIM